MGNDGENEIPGQARNDVEAEIPGQARNDGFWVVAGLALGAPPQAFRSERSERRNEAIAEGRT